MSRLPTDYSELPPNPPPQQQQQHSSTIHQQALRRSTRPGGQQQQQPSLNVHSRAAAREQLRLQQQQQQHGSAGGGVLSDLDSLHSLHRKDANTVFAPTPLADSMAGSAYVSGHLTPTDQWVAVRNDSSGVISLTSSDNEEDYIDSAFGIPPATDTGKGQSPMARHPLRSNLRPAVEDSATEFQIPLNARSHDSGLPGEPPYYAPQSSAKHWSAVVEEQGVNMDAEQAVHLLRESVVSLLSSGGSTTSSAASSTQPGGGRGGIGGNSRRRYGSLQHQGAYRASRSPSRLSKVSEPSYPPSAPRRQLTADFDHFSDVALTSITTPPHYHRHQPASAATSRAPVTTQFPTYEEFKQRQQGQRQPQLVPVLASTASPVAVQPTPVQASEVQPSTAAASVSAQPAAHIQGYHHPLLGNVQHQLFSEPMSEPMSRATYSPFASIRTVSPVLVTEDGAERFNSGRACSPSVSRAQAEAALQQAILCPPRSLHSPRYSTSTNHADSSEKARDGAIGNGTNSCSTQIWAKYTGYAIVGFGVGTLVGMLCFDMAATAAPKATRTIPIAAGF
ncbi:hypothetical protein GGI20_004414 [Coemansia sp. BCRC 34301]|nr:hypothetical protein GGI20_004414 [Coemansia sp. BCRC 34301]